MSETTEPRLLRVRAVTEKTGIPRSGIYALMAERKFPRPIPLYGRTVAWPSQAVDAWIKERIAAHPEARRAA